MDADHGGDLAKMVPKKWTKDRLWQLEQSLRRFAEENVASVATKDQALDAWSLAEELFHLGLDLPANASSQNVTRVRVVEAELTAIEDAVEELRRAMWVRDEEEARRRARGEEEGEEEQAAKKRTRSAGGKGGLGGPEDEACQDLFSSEVEVWRGGGGA